ncbi:GFA family protein [Polyangium aurulentum]|nr:GFA family protein [Polyangium aurulentum]
MEEAFSLEGGCACGAVRYRMTRRPLFVHCCHCTFCQRETGAAFAWNAMIESHLVEILAGEPEAVLTPLLERQGAEDRPLPRVPRRGLEPLRGRGRRRPLRARRHAERARPAPARHSHLHVLEAAVGRPSGGRRGRAGVLRSRGPLARREPRAAPGPARRIAPAPARSGATAGRRRA